MRTAAETGRSAQPRTSHLVSELSPRGSRARAKLIGAARIVIERVGYHRMRISDVTKEAGVATGLFYHYFPDLKTLTICVLEEFLTEFESFRIDTGDDWYKRIFHFSKLLVGQYAKNPGLVSCLLQTANQEPEFRDLYEASTNRQHLAIANLLPAMFPRAELSTAEAFLIVKSLGGTTESLLRDYYVTRNSVLRKARLSRTQMAELVATLFYRGLFLKDPEEPTSELALKLREINAATYQSPFLDTQD